MTQTTSTSNWLQEGMLAFGNGDYDGAIERFTRTLDGDANHKLAAVSRGAAFLKKGMIDQAQADFDRALAIDPGYARAYHLRGLVREKRGDRAAALADFDRAIDLDPEYGAAYYSRATLYTQLANMDKAQEDIQMATHLGNANMERFMGENNIWRTGQMRVEDALETELER